MLTASRFKTLLKIIFFSFTFVLVFFYFVTPKTTQADHTKPLTCNDSTKWGKNSGISSDYAGLVATLHQYNHNYDGSVTERITRDVIDSVNDLASHLDLTTIDTDGDMRNDRRGHSIDHLANGYVVDNYSSQVDFGNQSPRTEFESVYCYKYNQLTGNFVVGGGPHTYVFGPGSSHEYGNHWLLSPKSIWKGAWMHFPSDIPLDFPDTNRNNFALSLYQNGTNMDQSVTSIYVTGSACRPSDPTDCLTVYESANRGGGFYKPGTSKTNLSGLTFSNGVALNDNISSVHVPSGVFVTFFKNANYNGCTVGPGDWWDCNDLSQYSVSSSTETYKFVTSNLPNCSSGQPAYWEADLPNWNVNPGFSVTGGSTKRINIGYHCFVPPPAPNCNLSASPTTVTTGQRTTLSWTSSNATSGRITGPGGFNYNVSPFTASGSVQSPIITANSTFTMNVGGPGGSGSCQVLVTLQSLNLVIRNTSNGTSPAINGPTAVTCGQSAIYQAKTRNIGTGNITKATTTRATANGGASTAQQNFSIGNLNSNTSTSDHSFTTSWNSSGSKIVTFTADINSNVTESSEVDNAASIAVTVGSCSVPDFTLKCNSTVPSSVLCDGAQIQRGDSFTVYFQISPVNAFTGSISLSYTYNDPTISIQANPCGNSQGIPPSKACTFTVKTTSATALGSHTIIIRGTSPGYSDKQITPKFTVNVFVSSPWLQVLNGNTGSLSDIFSSGNSKSAYLVISTGSIASSFESTKRWIVDSYSLTVNPDISSNQYSNLRDEHSPTQISGVFSSIAAGKTKTVYTDTTPQTISSPITYSRSGDTAVIFINGDLNINSNIEIGAGSGVIFIVNRNVNIAAEVTRADGVYIVGGQFTTSGNISSASCPTNLSPTDQALTIHGAVYVTGKACFNRNLSGGNTSAAETIVYEPKYLWLFSDMIGSTRNIFKEVAP